MFIPIRMNASLSVCSFHAAVYTTMSVVNPWPPSDNEAAGSQRMFHKEREKGFLSTESANHWQFEQSASQKVLTLHSSTSQSIAVVCSPQTSLGPGQWAHSSNCPGNRTDLLSTVDCSDNKISTNNFWILTVWNLICCIHRPFKHSLSCKYKLPRAILQTVCLIRQIRDHLKTWLVVQCGIYTQENCRH